MKMLLLLISAFAPKAFADGMMAMELKDVLPLADIVVVAEIVSNDGTVVEKKNGQDVTAVQYAYNIKFRVSEQVKGEAPKEVELRYEFVVVKGVWAASSGSGLEMYMKAGEKYVLLLQSRDGKLNLLRAEKDTSLQAVKDLLVAQAKQKAGKEDPPTDSKPGAANVAPKP